MNELLSYQKRRKGIVILTLLLITFSSLFFFNSLQTNSNRLNSNIVFNENQESTTNEVQINTLKISPPYWASVNITSKSLNNTRFIRGTIINIKGNISSIVFGPRKNANVSIIINGKQYLEFSNKTNEHGFFGINLTIPYSLDVYKSHRIGVNVTDGKSVLFLNHLSISTSAYSQIQFTSASSSDLGIPYANGERITLVGALNYENGTGIPTSALNVEWNNGTGPFFSAGVIQSTGTGAYNEIVSIPKKLMSESSNSLRLKYSGFSPYTFQSSLVLSSTIKIFRTINCIWNMTVNATRGETIKIQGKIVSGDNDNFAINNRRIKIKYDDNVISTNNYTDSKGMFLLNYPIPNDTTIGNKTISVQIITGSQYDGAELVDSSGQISIVAVGGDTTGEDGGTGTDVTPPPPFLNFLMYFIPIISAIAAVIVVIGIRYYRKQEKKSQYIEVPLEQKIRNLKILKDTGRLEESLSYIFEAIYMDLVNAKYSRRRNENETIRDFAIISVKELHLNPTTIYPFIQKVENVIYHPYKISDRDFYDTVALFAPIYFDLTSHQFRLNF